METIRDMDKQIQQLVGPYIDPTYTRYRDRCNISTVNFLLRREGLGEPIFRLVAVDTYGSVFTWDTDIHGKTFFTTRGWNDSISGSDRSMGYYLHKVEGLTFEKQGKFGTKYSVTEKTHYIEIGVSIKYEGLFNREICLVSGEILAIYGKHFIDDSSFEKSKLIGVSDENTDIEDEFAKEDDDDWEYPEDYS